MSAASTMNRTALLMYSVWTTKRRKLQSERGCCSGLSGPSSAIVGTRNRREYSRPMDSVMAMTEAKVLRMRVTVAKRGVQVRTVDTADATIGTPVTMRDSL